MLKRRSFLHAAASLPLAAQGAGPGLRDIAAARNIVFGTEVTASDLRNPAYAALVARECALITPGIEAKWGVIQPREGAFNFGPMDEIALFARRHRMRLHLHNLLWGMSIPGWVTAALSEGRGRAIIAAQAGAIAARYGSAASCWDVVNEPVDPRWPSAAEGLCTTPWRHALGADYVPIAFARAAAACASAGAPGVRLLLNDDDLEYDAPDREKKRQTYLRLIEGWLRQGVPLHGFGLEAHLKPWLPMAEKQYRDFLRTLAGFGLHLYVTELDVCDRTLAAEPAARDSAVAAVTKRYLDLVLDEPAVGTIMTWGLADNTSWMLRVATAQRADGLLPRPLPYDSALREKPMRGAIALALKYARER